MRFLIAGLGAIGQRHARNLRGLYGESAELFAFRQRRLPHVITDSLERDLTRDVEQDLNITVFDNLEAALANPPDAVFVCTPSSLHMEIAQRVASAGSHLFIEKPLSDSLEGIERLRSTIASRNLVASVSSQWRFHPCIEWLRDLLKNKTLGPLRHAEIDYGEYLPDWHPYEDYRLSYAARAALGGGVVLTQIHDYDLAWWLFGPPSSVHAVGGRLSSLEIDVEDTVDALLEGGTVPVRVRQSFATRLPRRTITVTGERGTATVDLIRGEGRTSPQITADVAFPGYQRNEMFVEQLRQFRARLEGRGSSVASVDEGIAVLRLALAVRESIHCASDVRVF